MAALKNKRLKAPQLIVHMSFLLIASYNITLASSSPPAIKAPTLVRLNCCFSRSKLSMPSRVSVLLLTAKKWTG